MGKASIGIIQRNMDGCRVIAMLVVLILAIFNLTAGAVAARWADDVGHWRDWANDGCDDEYHLASACAAFHFINCFILVRVNIRLISIIHNRFFFKVWIIGSAHCYPSQTWIFIIRCTSEIMDNSNNNNKVFHMFLSTSPSVSQSLASCKC